MKIIKLLFVFLIFASASCVSVQVTTDYDTEINFNNYKTFAFYKKGIDNAKISDLDKKRIMRAIETELTAKGMVKSSTPDVLVSLFTKSREHINVNDHFYRGFYGGFYYPWYYGSNFINVSKQIEGTLFIDIIDAKKKELVWQGIGTGYLTNRSIKHKVERINEFVKEIIGRYPPNKKNLSTLKK